MSNETLPSLPLQSRSEVNHLRRYMSELGHINKSIAVLSMEVDQDKPEIPHPIVQEEYSLPEGHLHYDELLVEGIKVYGMRKASITRAWNAAKSAESHQKHIFCRDTEKEIIDDKSSNNNVVDLELVLGNIRSMEAGDIRINGFGEKSWNLIARFINLKLRNTDREPPLLLPWSVEIHGRMVNAGESRRYDLAYVLEQQYLQDSEQYARTSAQETLF